MSWRKEAQELAGPPRQSNDSLLVAGRFQQQLEFFDSGEMESSFQDTLDTCMEVMRRAQDHANEIDKDESGKFDRLDKLRVAELAAKIAKSAVGIAKEYLALKERTGKMGQRWYQHAAARWTLKHLKRHIKDDDLVKRILQSMGRDIAKEETLLARLLAEQLEDA